MGKIAMQPTTCIGQSIAPPYEHAPANRETAGLAPGRPPRPRPSRSGILLDDCPTSIHEAPFRRSFAIELCTSAAPLYGLGRSGAAAGARLGPAVLSPQDSRRAFCFLRQSGVHCPGYQGSSASRAPHHCTGGRGDVRTTESAGAGSAFARCRQPRPHESLLRCNNNVGQFS